MSDLLEGYAVTIDVPVAWGEMDAFGHVNNVVYFRWFESARIAWLFRVGFGGDTHEGVGPILASTHCRFRLPLAWPDTVRAGARATDVSEDRFTMEYRIVSIAQDALAVAAWSSRSITSVASRPRCLMTFAGQSRNSTASPDADGLPG
jgi:acyl-CoA thioester hydrolase